MLSVCLPPGLFGFWGAGAGFCEFFVFCGRFFSVFSGCGFRGLGVFRCVGVV